MKNYSLVVSASPISDTKILVEFDSGVTGVFDCSPFFRDPYWKRLADPAFFRLVRVECGTLVWPGDIDIAPEDVWEKTVRDPVAACDQSLSVAEDGAEYGASQNPGNPPV